MAKAKRAPDPLLATARNRRERRRMEKSLKKKRHLAYCRKKSHGDETQTKPREEKVVAKPSPKLQSEEKALKKRKAKKEKRERQRLEEQREMIEMEDREIRSFAKKLGLNKRRKKDTLPKSFADAGLDYLLDICRGANFDKDAGDPSEGLSDSDVDGEELDAFTDGHDTPNGSEQASDTPSVSDDHLRKRKVPQSRDPKDEEKGSASKKRVRFSGLPGDAHNDDTDLAETPEDDVDLGDEAGSDPEEEEVEGVEEDSGAEDQLHEDIYGRLRNKKGEVVSLGADSSSGPRFFSASNTKGEMSEVDPKLVRALKGSLNRLSESNARQTATQINQLLLTYSKNDVKVVLTQSIFGVCLAQEIVPQRLVMEYCYLLALLHSSVTIELSSYFIERLAKQFRELHEMAKAATDQRIVDKRLNNACQLFAFCYHLKIVSSVLIMQLMRDVLESFKERDIELMLLILQTSGFMLRKDNPTDLKNLMTDVHRKINAPENASLKNEPRTKFMLDTLSAIKNNNDTKVASYDPSLTEHFRKLIRASVKSIETPLPMSLHDLYEAEEKGRWWIVGSAVSSNLIEAKKLEKNPQARSASTRMQATFDEGLLELARKHRMNTDLRRTIFCVIMSAEDYLDAFEKLMKLDLRGQQEREIIHVCLTCCINERRFNPYYGWLVRHLCQYHKRFQLTTQFAIWDKIKLLKDLERWQRHNLALLLSQVVASKAISLSVLKIFEFGELETTSIKLLKTFFKDLLLTCTTAEVEEIFKRAASKDQLKVFFDGVLVFLQHFFSQKRNLADEQSEAIDERIAVIERLRFR